MSTEESKELTVKEKLKALYKLQVVASKIDKIKILRGELPMEVQDLEDEVAGLKTRISKYKNDIKEANTNISDLKIEENKSSELIAKYKTQQDNVRNNREYDFLSKEIEYQELEIKLDEKKIREAQVLITNLSEEVEKSGLLLEEREKDLEQKKNELENIISDTKTEEETLVSEAKGIEKDIEPRLLSAFKRIRKNARNGLAVVTVQRDACSGCFNKIPPQRQMDIKMSKKIIVCEYCGRILVDDNINNDGTEEQPEEVKKEVKTKRKKN